MFRPTRHQIAGNYGPPRHESRWRDEMADVDRTSGLVVGLDRSDRLISVEWHRSRPILRLPHTARIGTSRALPGGLQLWLTGYAPERDAHEGAVNERRRPPDHSRDRAV